MYGFIHCCLEDMVLQLFGEAAWREILNNAGIKLRGASFLMHQVYDDETTFKLVAAASNVSGLPVEVCLEEFGKHFLVYCQKNGYDQILRVLGSNLYDFLTNLDNLHDHLASIYPGMRAPSFRVTRNLDTNTTDDLAATRRRKSSLESSCSSSSSSTSSADTQLAHDQRQSSPNCGSMYLHYYSERNGLSPIVKGLVMAVAKEFFSTDIVVTECKPKSSSPPHGNDDHVVLKIDRRSQANIALDEEASQAVGQAAAEAASRDQDYCDQQHQQHQQDHQQLRPSKSGPQQQPQQQHKTMLNSLYGDSLSKMAQDSLVNSEIMMKTFPFHVIFDRQFNLVQVGESLLRVTSFYWKQRAREQEQQQQAKRRVVTFQRDDNNEQVDDHDDQDLVKFSDLFSIVRPKIEFTFDAIADHTNQVFVVKTRPLVLNADRVRATTAAPPTTSAAQCPAAVDQSRPIQQRPTCPMDRIAASRRQSTMRMVHQEQQQLELDKHPPPVVDQTHQQQPHQQPQPQAEHQQQQQFDEWGEPINYLSLRLKGQMIILSEFGNAATSEGPYCLFLCSPRVDHLNQLLESGVSMSQLALHDRARELMLMSHTHKEDREAVKKLDQATNDLKKMDTKLRQENKRTNEVLHNIFPAKIATMLSHGSRVESESFDLVTCLYSDIIGFTKMCGSENVRPIDIVRLLNTLYLQFDNLTNIHGVFKVETIGDAYVVVGGLPEPAEDHADRCVKMGLDMVKVIATVRSPADGLPIQMRIGIHSGPVMAGIVGIRVPRYSLFGNTTTQANQLETNGVGGKIHISDFTLKNLIKRDRFVIENNPNQVGSVPFKTYFVTNYLSDEIETQKHERILEEQLIKDFELMGNEVELVDDELHRHRVHHHSRAKPHQQHHHQQPVDSAANLKQKRTDSIENSNLIEQQQQLDDRNEANRLIRSRAAAAAADDNLATTRPTRTLLTERLLAADDERPPTVRMDVEANYKRDILELANCSGRELVQLATQMGESIVSESLKQFDEMRTFDRLLALLVGRQTGLNLVIGGGAHDRQRTAPAAPSDDSLLPKSDPAAAATWSPLDKQASGGGRHTCPLCDGVGQLDLVGDDLGRIRLAAATAVAALALGSSADIINNSPPAIATNSQLEIVATKQRKQQHSSSFVDNNGEQQQQQQHEKIKISAPRQQFRPANDDNPAAAAAQSANSTDDSRRSLPTTADNAELAHQNPRQQLEASEHDDNRQARDLHSDRHGLEQLLADLRAERIKLEAQIDKLGQLSWLKQQATESTDDNEGDADDDPASDSHGHLRHHRRAVKSIGPADGSQLRETTRGQPAGGGDAAKQQRQPAELVSGQQRPISAAGRTVGGGGRLLSSNIQRMKRMDTLKRRKLKRDQQQQQQPAPTTPQELSTGEQDETSSMIRFAKPLIEDGDTHDKAKLQSARVAIPEDEEEQEPGDDDGEVLKQKLESLARLAAIETGAKQNDQKQQQRDCSSATQPHQQPAKQPAYNYQSIRASIANLMSEAVGGQPSSQQPPQQQQVQEQQGTGASRRKRFSLSSFGSTVSAVFVSPFSSPVKRPTQQQQQQHHVRTNQQQQPPNSLFATSQLAGDDQRKPSSSRSHSSGSGSNLTASARNSVKSTSTNQKERRELTAASGNTNNNGCSCLKSSGSSQSVESDVR